MLETLFFHQYLQRWGMSTCEVCKSGALIRIPTRATLEIFVKCSKCGLLQKSEVKTPSKIEGNAFLDYASAQDLAFEKIRRSAVLLQLKQILAERNLELSVFDIGTGAGHFLMDAQESGFRVGGNELSDSAAALVFQNYGIQIPVLDYEAFDFVDCQSAVTMFCVLAHSVDPELLLRSIHQSLKSGGVLYFHTPRYCLIDSIGIFFCRISFGKFDQIFLRRIGGDHRRIYSETSLLKLLDEAGFSRIRMTAEIGYGLKKEHYFMGIGLPKVISIFLSKVLDLISKFSHLPRNVYSVYSIKT